MPKLTKRFVDSLGTEGMNASVHHRLVWDDELPGFGLRVMPSGIRAYLVQYRNAQGRSRRLTIGRHGVLTTDQARTQARALLAAVAGGADPRAERSAVREAPTVCELLDRYVAEYVEKRNRPTAKKEIKRLIARHIRPQIGHLKVAAVTRQDMVKLHLSLAATPIQANNVIAWCSKAFSLAESWGMRPDGTNPCSKVERNPERHRERFLSLPELARLGATLRLAETEGLPWGVDETKPKARHLPKPENRRTVYPRLLTAAIELLLYTGCRLSEVLNLRWPQVDLDEGTITLVETKAGRPQVIAVNAPARQVLQELMPAGNSEPTGWVLPRQRDPARPLSIYNLESVWQRIRAAAELEDVRLHDLRHTVGTYAGQSGANAFMVRDLLRHSGLAMTGRYVNRSADPVRALSNHVGERIAAGLAGSTGAEIVPLKRGTPRERLQET